jgi:predicted ABC-type transport system involved in lysophospholipase L1 biosynthesis ATPase subunit
MTPPHARTRPPRRAASPVLTAKIGHAEPSPDQRRFAIAEATRKLDAAAIVLAADVLAGTLDVDTAVGVLDLIDRAAAHLRWAA